MDLAGEAFLGTESCFDNVLRPVSSWGCYYVDRSLCPASNYPAIFLRLIDFQDTVPGAVQEEVQEGAGDLSSDIPSLIRLFSKPFRWYEPYGRPPCLAAPASPGARVRTD